MAEIKIPKTLGACADRLYALKAEKKKAREVVNALEAEESALNNHIIDNLPKSEGGAMGKFAKVRVYTEPVPTVEDWEKLYTYIKKNDAFDLIQKRLSPAAVEERWAAKKKVPGVGTFNVVKISLTKI